MLYREIIAVYSRIHTKAEFLNIKLVIHKVASGPFWVPIHYYWKIRRFYGVFGKPSGF